MFIQANMTMRAVVAVTARVVSTETRKRKDVAHSGVNECSASLDGQRPMSPAVLRETKSEQFSHLADSVTRHYRDIAERLRRQRDAPQSNNARDVNRSASTRVVQVHEYVRHPAATTCSNGP